MNDYKEKLKNERKWYSQNTFVRDHFLNSRLFYSQERNNFNYLFPRKQLMNFVVETAGKCNLRDPAVLIAPVGAGEDIPYFKDFAGKICGIDIAEEALKNIHDASIEKYVGDIKEMRMFPDNYFDIVIVPLFFHHFCSFGFDDFLIEIKRVLKPQGHFFSLEPSLLYPLSWITTVAKRIFGNITGLVEGEGPFFPFKLSRAMKRCGFKSITVYGASFSHNRLPIGLAKINNMLTYPFLRFPLLKYFGWMCLFYGRKE